MYNSPHSNFLPNEAIQLARWFPTFKIKASSEGFVISFLQFRGVLGFQRLKRPNCYNSLSLFKNNFISLYLAVLGLHCCAGFSLVVMSWGYSLWLCTGFSLQWLLLWSTGFRVQTSVVVAPRFQRTGSTLVVHGLSCSEARGIFPDQGSNPCLLHWQLDSLPLSHQGSPSLSFKIPFSIQYIFIIDWLKHMEINQQGHGEKVNIQR